MRLTHLLLPMALAVGLSACATATPSSVAHQASIAGPVFQEQPETLAQWKVLAERMAAQAAPHLAGLAVSPRATGVASAFDVGFHDFFVSALHAQGVALDERGARVEIDTYPLAFPAHPYHVRNVDGRQGVAPPHELGVTVRVFAGTRLAYSGSQAYYLPAADLPNYLSVPRTSRRIQVVGE